MRKNLFYLGLIIFYLIIFFAPNKPTYFAAYIISTLCFYLANNDVRISLFYTLILALFSDVRLSGNVSDEAREASFGISYFLSPMTLTIICLIPLSITKKIRSITSSDIFIFLFLVWNIVIFIIFPYQNVLSGILSLGQTTLLYFIFRIYISNKNVNNVSSVLISMVIFQSILGSSQFLLKRPIGLLIESVTTTNPFGLTAVEDINLFRVTGTFGHPNAFASFLLTTIPFLFLFPWTNNLITIFKSISPVILFLTYTRTAWVIFILQSILMFLKNKLHYIHIPLKRVLITIPVILIVFIFLFPYLLLRLNTIPTVFTEGGSMDVRLKLAQEGINLITQYPITGVGLNRALETYTANPYTNIFELGSPSNFYKIHNLFLEMAAEIGIPGFFLFFLFLIFTIKSYFSRTNPYYKKAAFFGLLGLIGISMLNPFFHTSQLRLFFLLSAIILA